MEITLRPLKECTPEMLADVARLHHAAMPTLLSHLGLPFVERYFQAGAADPTVISLVALLPDGRTPVGYVIGCPRPERLMGQLKTPFSWFVRQTLRLLFTRPGVLLQLAVSALSIQGQMGSDPSVIEVSYLSISPEARGAGLGERLMRAFLDICRQAEYRAVVLSVEIENQAAVAMHKKVGFRIKKTFREGRFHRHRMENLL
ncbi:MAG: GNAT family N-acetyltransferase [Anaerolineaceae bacterium]|nr:GNAT family N-acetyltransferase [Anaerolineaceae bacterium]